MDWASRNAPACPWIATFATDAPFLPVTLVEALLARVAAEGAEMACAVSNGRAQPVFGLWPVRLAADLRAAVVDAGLRKVDIWTAAHRLVEVAFPDTPVDPFFNANRPEDLVEAERLLENHGDG
jgi:molybdopterin-guanine dinucleotide biosynthesis protein A